MSAIGVYLKELRQNLQAKHSGFSIRSLAARVGIHHSYLSKLERGEHAPLTEDRMYALARELGEDPEYLCALGGKLTERLSALLLRNKHHFFNFVRQMETDSCKSEDQAALENRILHRNEELTILSRHLKDQIAAYQQIEKDLQHQKNLFLSIVQSLEGTAIACLDRDFSLVWASARMLALAKDPEYQGKKCYAHFFNRDAPCPDCKAAQSMSALQVMDEYRIGPDNTKWYIKSVPVLGPDGKLQKLVRFGSDMSQIGLALASLIASDQKWNLAFDASREGIWDWNPQTDARYFSEGLQRLLDLGDSDRPHTQQEWRELLHPDDRDAAIAQLDEYLAGKDDHYESLHRLRCQGGTYRWFLSRGCLVERNPPGLPQRVIGTYLDLSDIREVLRFNMDR